MPAVHPAELAADDQRLADIEHGVLDLDWLMRGYHEPDAIDPIDLDPAGPPLSAWRNPYGDPSEPS
jgi:hypothetical protein